LGDSAPLRHVSTCETWASLDAIFRQINKDVPRVYPDALEFPDGTFVLLTDWAGTRSLGAR
jgi:hypothetical protein